MPEVRFLELVQELGKTELKMAARAAVSSPLLDLSIEGARGVLFNIAGGADLTMYEVDEAARIISSTADPDANVIFGAVIKDDLADQVRLRLSLPVLTRPGRVLHK